MEETLMKKSLIILLPLLLATCGFAQVMVIKNPATPKHPNPNRVYKLKPLLTIEDDGERFFFKKPGSMTLDSAGNLYLVDKKQLLGFDSAGNFIRNFRTPGTGPGEVKSLGNYLVRADGKLMIMDIMPNKYLLLARDGRLLDEKRIHSTDSLYLLHSTQDKIYIHYKEMRGDTKNFVLKELKNVIASVSPKDGALNSIFSLPTKHAMMKMGGHYMYISYTDLIYHQFKDNLFYFVHTDDYRIKLIDIDTGKTNLLISRDYKKVPVTGELKKYLAHVSFNNESVHYESPYPDYMNAIQYIQVVNEKLLVFTSTVEKDKGVLVDVFDAKGVFTDSFFLKISNEEVLNQLNQGWVCANNKAIYALDRDEDNNWVISKYSFEEVVKELK